MLERNFERITITLVAILFFLGSCATWQQTAKFSLTTANTVVKAAEPSLIDYFNKECETLKDEALDKCVARAKLVKQLISSFYETMKLGLIAITLGDEQTTMEYVAKATKMATNIYTILKTFLEEKLPTLPVFEIPSSPTSQPVAK